ncbi:hypothetical protein [Pseudoalteromonas peptidolytica]|uniref:hypothetical protein n=1 Tax=Pseudoalteromonas peptidolytica TaxID=61150 RepID=UPI00298E2083|nr:hypothetical protein [Pseudoalteromonas peptidolytica]MDW7549435.1 hypothetical protein [Pseudoalteromonas peptidolytica]
MLALIAVFINCIIVWFDLRKKSPFVAFSGSTLFVFSLPHFYASLVSTDFSSTTFFEVSVHATIFFIVYGCVRLLLLNYQTNQNELPFVNVNTINSEMLFSVLMMLFFVIGVFASFDFNVKQLIFSNWADFRNESSMYKLIATFCFYSGSGLLLVAFLSRRWGIFVVGLFFMIAVGSILKTRGYLIALICPLIIYYLLYREWNTRKLFGLFLLITLLFSLYSGARILRHAGSLSEVSISSFSQIKVDKSEFQLVNTLYYFVEKGGVELEVSNPTLIRILLLPIPSLLIDKPAELSHQLWDQKVGTLGIAGSLHATVVGDSILAMKNFGAVIYAFIYGLLFSLVEIIFQKNRAGKILYFSLICTFSFYVARGAVYNGFINMLVGSALIFTFTLIKNIKVRKGEYK